MYVSIGHSSNLFKPSFKRAAHRLVCYKVVKFWSSVLYIQFMVVNIISLLVIISVLTSSVHKIWIPFHFLCLTFTTDISVLIAQVAVLYKIVIKRVSKSYVVRACFWCHVTVRNGTSCCVIRFQSYRTPDCLYTRSPGSDASLGLINIVLIYGPT